MLVVPILGSFLLVTSVASSQDEPDTLQWERRLTQLELKLQNVSEVQNSILIQQNSLLESLASQFNQMLTLQTKHQQRIIKSCDEATTSGRYRLELPDSSIKPVVCDMKELDGGWLVIQHRFSGAVSFNRSWAEYRDGFGPVGKSDEFWLGLETVHQLTRGGDYELLVELEHNDSEGFARYQKFELAGEDEGYKMVAVDEHHGNMGDQLQFSKNNKFSTYDRINDETAGNSPQVYGCGWWFSGFNAVILNGCNCGFGYELLEHRLEQMELKKQKEFEVQNALLESMVKGLTALTQQTSQVRWLASDSDVAPRGSVNFNRSWTEYRDGFGNVGLSGEFWLGLETIHQLTKAGDQELFVQLKNETGHSAYGRYKRFQVAGADQKYRLSSLGEFSGAIGEKLNISRDEAFSTYDKDNDQWTDGNCAQILVVDGGFTSAVTPETHDGGWLVIQSRSSGSVNFNRSWTEYRDGFGNVGLSGEFWLGLETIHQLTKAGDQELLVQLKDETGHSAYGRYKRFQVAGADQRYRLSPLGEFSGAIGEKLDNSRNEAFSTYDKDNDPRYGENCAQKYGGGWWFYNCGFTSLNGSYKKDNNTGYGIFWKGFTNAGTYSRMLIRRR
ncbi:hypothetical protein pipiens_005229 [Culex pipiens pipiens]|uniref:Fibrinogen C-terminal domain-containing protein n=1 Tax=Culex pipiens pipiens TaxID=38569 RepID=A0ABD1DYD9_CULPP